VTVLYRNNVGYDFGGWSDALLQNNMYQKYTHFIFANSSIIGPFVKGKWTDVFVNGLSETIKLFGCTINTMKKPNTKAHVQSYLFSMTLPTLVYLIETGIFSTTYVKTFQAAIDEKEIKMSRLIVNHGWNIGCLLQCFKHVDFTNCKRETHPNILYTVADLMYSKYMNIHWTPKELIFIKGNRIHVVPESHSVALSEQCLGHCKKKHTSTQLKKDLTAHKNMHLMSMPLT
jgi:hypothetical protein